MLEKAILYYLSRRLSNILVLYFAVLLIGILPGFCDCFFWWRSSHNQVYQWDRQIQNAPNRRTKPTPNLPRKQNRPCASLPQVRPAINIPAGKTEGVFFLLLPGRSPIPPTLLWNLPALSALGCDSTLTSGLGFLSLIHKENQPEECSQWYLNQDVHTGSCMAAMCVIIKKGCGIWHKTLM